jgi:uncharacterized membrane protein
MGTGLIAMGILFWGLSIMGAYIFDTPKKDKIFDRMKASIRLRPNNISGASFVLTLMQITTVYWIIIGILLKIMGDNWLSSFLGNIMLFVILGLPLLIGAIFVERRKK